MENNRVECVSGVEDSINHDYITQYIRSLLPVRVGIQAELERYAMQEHVPIVQPEVARFLETLCGLLQPRSILEVGTAIGYSAMLMYFACEKGPHITTIERYDKMVEQARRNFERAGMARDVTLIEGDAALVLDELDGPYDLIFVDAAKGQYPLFLQHSLRLLRPGGVLLCDNVLYQGMTASDEKVIRRKITIVKRMRDFLEQVMHHPQLDSSLLPLGDGVTISRKRPD
ncbi:MAG: O-methyltransferase [Eubacteriales bacterium]|jgi:predicted O-methyltransferase YrrM